MQGKGVVSAIVEDLEDIFINHNISEEFLGEGNGLVLVLFMHGVEIEEEGIGLVIQLHHLHVSAASQPPFKVHA